MRASRLLSVMMTLQARGRLSAPEMAAKLEVSVRTIYRDIDQLSAAGIPVVADRGRRGGFKLVDGFRAQLGALTSAEAETLFLAGLPGPAAELGFAHLTDAGHSKLMAALPGGARTERFAARFHIDTRGWFRSSDAVEHLPTIAQAVRKSAFLSIRYGLDKTAIARKVGPAGLVLKAGIWYLMAEQNGTFRTYRVSRISEARILAEPYSRPLGFDLPERWARSSREFEAGSYRVRAVVRLSPRGRSLVDLLGPYVLTAVAKTASSPDRQGWIRCRIPLESMEFGTRELLRLGADVEVVSPPALRILMQRTLGATLKHYANHKRGR